MPHAADAPIQQDRSFSRGETTRAAETLVEIGKGAVTEAQGKAREWADKALTSYQAGEVDAYRDAQRQAEFWLARMLELEFAHRTHASAAPSRERSTASHWNHRTRKAHASVPDSLSTSPAVTYSEALRAWR
jgi:hypothetical protein